MVEYEIDKKRSLIIGKFKGTVNVDDIINLKKDKYISKNIRSFKNVLIDIRFANIEDITFGCFSNLFPFRALLDKFRPKNYCLVVGSYEQLFSPLSMELKKILSNSIKPFYDYDQALQWIENNNKDDKS